jgi:hypothetical protein
MTARLDDLTRAACLAGTIALATALLAAGVRLLAAGELRAWLGFEFVGIPPRLGELVAIVLNNLALLGVALGGAVVAQLRRRRPARGLRALVWACDAIIVLECLQHVVLVGVTLGAYGRTGLAAVLPHGPVELAGFSVGLSLYVSSRREALAWRRGLALAALAAGTLVLAAVLEVFL